jgi:DNA processing protein
VDARRPRPAAPPHRRHRRRRIASAAGQRFARALAAELGQAGYVVVSGLARGVDAAAHEGALPTGTAAVLGGGVDDVYPPENAGLYDRLVASGCVVSESAVGRRAQAKDFPRRNRIISGLSEGVVVVEAELRSGSLITARLAPSRGARSSPFRLAAGAARPRDQRPDPPGRRALRGRGRRAGGSAGPCRSPQRAALVSTGLGDGETIESA